MKVLFLSLIVLFISCNRPEEQKLKFDYFKENKLSLSSHIDSINLNLKDISEYSELKEPEQKVLLYEGTYIFNKDTLSVRNIINAKNDYIESFVTTFQSKDSIISSDFKNKLKNAYPFVNKERKTKNILEAYEYSDHKMKIVLVYLKNKKVYTISISVFPG